MSDHKELQETLLVQYMVEPHLIAADHWGTYIYMKNSKRVLFAITEGAWQSDLTAQVVQKNSVTGVVKDVAGRTCTITTGKTLTLQLLEVDAQELDINGGFDQVTIKFSLTAGGNGCIVDAIAIRDPTWEPSTEVTA
jgi:hypothetical protein